MKKAPILLLIIFFLLPVLIFGQGKLIHSSRADSLKTVTVTFKAAPTPASVNVNKTLVKYNKDVAFSWGFDDGYKEGYEYGFKYLSGGYNSTLASYFNGLYFTDGAGHSRPFTGSYSWFSVDSNYNDLHASSSLSYMSWEDLIDSYNYGWMPLNHGWTSMNFPSATSTFNYPLPKGPGLFDYQYEIEQNNAQVLSQAGINMGHFVIPGGDQAYIDPAWLAGMKSVSSNTNNFQYGGEGHVVPTEGVSLSTFNDDHFVMHREYFSEGTNLTDASMVQYIDDIVDKSGGADKYWAIGFTHRVLPGATGGNLSWNRFKYMMDYIAANYGRDGADNVWMTSYQEAYDYARVYQGVTLSTELAGDTLTISFDSASLPADLRHYALSLLVSADQEIKSITYGTGDFTGHSENLLSGLINLDWGFFLEQDEYTKSELKVSAAEASRIAADASTAQGYVNVLPVGPKKNILQNRLSNIAVLGKIWRINFGISGYTTGTWNNYGGDKAPYNQLLSNLIDTDNNTSNVSVQIVQDFTSKLTSGMTTGNNSGVIPDTYLQSLVRIYAAAPKTGTVRFSGLDPAKNYDLFIVGSYNIASSSKSFSLYTVKGVTKVFNAAQNTSTGVTFASVVPEADGTLDVSVAAQDTSWGYGSLNAIELRERSENKPVASIISAARRSSSNVVDLNYSLKHDDADPIDLSDLRYSTTGLFAGEELSVTAAIDAQNDGVTGVSSSVNGTTHRFVWNAGSDLYNFEGEAYLRFRPQGLVKLGSFAQTEAIAVDFKAPVISDLAASAASTSAAVSWQTHEDAYAKTELGLSTAYGLSAGSLTAGSLLKNRTLNVTDLQTCAIYHYRGLSRDAAANDRQSADQSFRTAGCLGNAAVSAQREQAFAVNAAQDLTLDNLRLVLPANALSGSPVLQIFHLDKEAVLSAAPLANDKRAVGNSAFSLNAYSSNSTKLHDLNQTAVLSFTYQDADLFGLDPASLVFSHWDGTAWSDLTDCTLNSEEKKVSCPTNHFSDFILTGSESIPGVPTIITPSQAGIKLAGNENYQLSWTIPSDDDLDYFNLDYSLDGGSTWQTLAHNLASTTAVYDWSLPAVDNLNVRARVTVYDTFGNHNEDISDFSFTIDSSAPVISLATASLGNIRVATAAGASATDNYAGVGTYSWSKVSGPGNVSFSSSANIVNPSLSADVAGTYRVRLTVTDNVGHIAASDLDFIWEIVTDSEETEQVLFSSNLPVLSPPQVPSDGFFREKISNGGGDDTEEFVVKTENSIFSLPLNAGADVDRLAISVSDSFQEAGLQKYQTPLSVNLCNLFANCSYGKYRLFVRFYTSAGISSKTLKVLVDYQAPAAESVLSEPIIPSLLAKRLAGRILLQVEKRGEAWYVSPENFRRYYLRDGAAAYELMRRQGRGINNLNLKRLQVDKKFASKFKGYIFLQVESRGEAWYVDENLDLHYLRDGVAAYELMRRLGLGITDKNLEQVMIN